MPGPGFGPPVAQDLLGDVGVEWRTVLGSGEDPQPRPGQRGLDGASGAVHARPGGRVVEAIAAGEPDDLDPGAIAEERKAVQPLRRGGRVEDDAEASEPARRRQRRIEGTEGRVRGHRSMLPQGPAGGVSPTTTGGGVRLDRPRSGGTFLLTPLLRLVRSLRTAGVPVSSSEVIDATWAFRSIDIGDRAQVRAALAATLVKRAEDRAAFDLLFDVHFAIRGRTTGSRRGTAW